MANVVLHGSNCPETIVADGISWSCMLAADHKGDHVARDGTRFTPEQTFSATHAKAVADEQRLRDRINAAGAEMTRS